MKQIKDAMIKNQKESHESYSGKVKKIELNGDIIDSELEIILSSGDGLKITG